MLKKLECMLDMLADTAKCEFDKGIDNVDTSEMGEVIDMIKDLAKALYHLEVFYNMKGDYRMSPEMYREHDAEYYRDMDREHGIRYYTEMSEHDKYAGESCEDYMNLMKYIFENHMGTADEKQMVRTHVDKFMNSLWEDIQKLWEHLGSEERTVIKSKMTTMLSRM